MKEKLNKKSDNLKKSEFVQGKGKTITHYKTRTAMEKKKYTGYALF